MKQLKGKKVAILATHGFEQSELTVPLEKLREAGAEAQVISLESGHIKGWDMDHWGEEIPVDATLDTVEAADFDALVLPGGLFNPDTLRSHDQAVAFVGAFFQPEKQKPVAAICHGPWTLINADVVKGRKMTSYKSIRKDLQNAGAEWVDEAVVVDNGLVTSRTPDDLEAFMAKTIEEIAEGRHAA